MSLVVDVVSIFPEIFAPTLRFGMTGRALAKGAVELYVTDLRDHARDKHRSTDDTPYGGGCGMVMLLAKAIALQGLAPSAWQSSNHDPEESAEAAKPPNQRLPPPLVRRKTQVAGSQVRVPCLRTSPLTLRSNPRYASG